MTTNIPVGGVVTQGEKTNTCYQAATAWALGLGLGLLAGPWCAARIGAPASKLQAGSALRPGSLAAQCQSQDSSSGQTVSVAPRPEESEAKRGAGEEVWGALDTAREMGMVCGQEGQRGPRLALGTLGGTERDSV